MKIFVPAARILDLNLMRADYKQILMHYALVPVTVNKENDGKGLTGMQQFAMFTVTGTRL